MYGAVFLSDFFLFDFPQETSRKEDLDFPMRRLYETADTGQSQQIFISLTHIIY